MLKIIEFIKSHKNWNELLANPPYSLNIKEKGNLVLFNYSQIATDASIPLTKEARGLILEKNNWNVICYGFNRFFNIGESNAAQIDWKSAFATSKEDGTLFFLYYYNDEWHIRTRSTFDAIEAPLDNGQFKNYRQLFDYVLGFYPNFNFQNLNKKYTYCLECCSQFNKIVLDYPEPKLYHILTRDNSTLEEVNENIGIPKPAHYYLEDEADYKSFVEEMSENHEGIVVQDKYNNRVKIKTQTYFALHHLVANHCITLRKAIFLIWTNEQNELLSYFPEFISYFDQVKTQLDQVKTQLDSIQKETEEIKTRSIRKKDFVRELENKEKKEKALYFLAYDDKLYKTFSYNPEDTDEQTMTKIKKLITTFKLDA